jgi:hypothetical protein
MRNTQKTAVLTYFAAEVWSLAQLRDLFPTPNIIRVIIKEVGAERAKDKRYAYTALVGIRE